jgi:hypothetical protein
MCHYFILTKYWCRLQNLLKLFGALVKGRLANVTSIPAYLKVESLSIRDYARSKLVVLAKLNLLLAGELCH